VPYSDMILGLDPGAEYTDTTIEIQPGSALVSYTDGLLEQPMAPGEQLGEAGVLEAVRHAHGSPQPVDSLVEHVLDISQRRTFGDDILLFWLQRDADREPAALRSGPRWFSPFAEAQGSV